MKVVVMGAGLAGVTTAWYLAKDGHEVVVVDREPEIAAAASFANAGIIAASRAYPWPAKGLAAAALQSLSRFDAELWQWGLQHLALRASGSYRRILEAKVRLVRYSQQRLHRLVEETGIRYRRLANGVLYLHRSEAELEESWRRAAVMRDLGFAMERLEPAQVAEREPAISQEKIRGAIYAPGDEAGDAALFCRELAAASRRAGVSFYLDCEILGLQALDVSLRDLVTRKGRIRGDAFVCALGVIEPRLREQLGASLPIYPVKGYSANVPLARPQSAPTRAGIDETRQVAYCPMGEDLRITGGADFAGYGKAYSERNFAPLYAAIEELYPDRLAEQYEILARHFSAAEEREKALEYFAKAGDKAARAVALGEALALYEDALALVDPDNPMKKADLLVKLANVSTFVTSDAEADRVLAHAESALPFFERLGDKRSLLNTHLNVAALYIGGYWDATREDKALEHLEAAAALAEGDPDSVEKGLTYQRMGHLYLHRGQPATAIPWAQRAADLFARLRVPIGTALGTALTYTGQIDEGIAYNEKNWEPVLKVGNPLVIAILGHELSLSARVLSLLPFPPARAALLPEGATAGAPGV